MTWPPVPRARGAPGADGLPLLRGQAADAGQASGLVLRGVIAEASPLRDSAGITPASLGQRRPGRGQDTGSVPQPARPAGPVARAVDSPADKSAPAGDNFPVAVDSGVDSENGHKLCGQGLVSARRLAVERLSPLRRARPEGNSGTAGGRGDRPSPTGARCRWRPRGGGPPGAPAGPGRPAVAGPSRPLHLIHGGASSHFDGCRAGNPAATRGTSGVHWGEPVLTNCAQRVTPCAMAGDNETDVGGVGTPELTSPRLSPFPGRARLSRFQRAGVAAPTRGSCGHLTAPAVPAGCRAR
jgi:hypothetical protein